MHQILQKGTFCLLVRSEVPAIGYVSKIPGSSWFSYAIKEIYYFVIQNIMQ